jgi:putative ABC transport system ATP-binding protein
LYNLELAIRNNKEIKKSNLKNLIEKYMIKLELNLDINRKVYTLSGGEQQRIALIRLFLKPCKLILADEPTGSLDDKSSEIVINFLRELSKEKSVVIVTHDSNLINSIEKRIKIG